MMRPWNFFRKKKSKKGYRATDANCSPPLKKKDAPGKSDVISGSLQKDKRETQKMETTESEDCLSEDEGIAKRLSAMPRGATIISEEELSEMSQIKILQRRSGSNCNTDNLIQKFRKLIEQEEILKEYVSLEHLKPTDDCQIAAAVENREKNRYRDILPYDKTRVPLGEAEGYINASYIRVPVGKEEFFYISTQGPLPSTVNDFWQMVWENQSNVIAMITREEERGTLKCHRYWPESPQETLMDLSQFQLRMSNYQILDCFIIRVIEVTNKQTLEKRLVHHLQFTSWPDHGTPASSKDLVKFVRYMRKVHQSGPIIAHCSAGIGRSGVLLCVDIMLSSIEKDMPFDIKQIVTNLRQQRCGMIQTKEQYMFCYDLALEVLKNIQSTNSSPAQ